MKKRLIAFSVALVLITGFVLLGCNDDPGKDKKQGPEVINLYAIPGVTPPSVEETPVSAIGESSQYTGTVTWSGNPATFGRETVYTATITLTAKTGFTLTGIEANKFTVAGATSVTHSANSGVVTAVFPATLAVASVPVTIKAIAGITAPAHNGTPTGTITETAEFTGTVTWSGNPATFGPGVAYTATINLTAKPGFTFTGISANFFTVAGAAATNLENSGVVTAVYPATIDEGNAATYIVQVVDGVLHKANTTRLTLRFSQGGADWPPPDNALNRDNVIITSKGGSATVLSVSARGASRTVNISVQEEGEIGISINLAGISSAERTAFVFMKLGLQEDPSINITHIVKMEDKGTPVAGGDITFGRYDGDPIAILTPVTTNPVSSVSASTPAMEHLLATFDPPLDLDDGTYGEIFKWFEMVWDGFGEDYTFDTPSSLGGNAGYTYTGTNFSLYSATFQLVLIDDLGRTIRFNKGSATNSDDSTAKNPVRFLVDDISTAAGNTSWAGSTKRISSITLRITGMQLRCPDDRAWGDINSERSPVLLDTRIKSLTFAMAAPPEPFTLFDEERSPMWNAAVVSPRYGVADGIITSPAQGTSAAAGFGVVTFIIDEPQNWVWNPINLTTLLPEWPNYDYMVVYYSGAITSFGTACVIYDDALTGAWRRDFNFSSYNITGHNPIKIPLEALVNGQIFNPNTVRGFGIQFNGGSVQVTKITFE